MHKTLLPIITRSSIGCLALLVATALRGAATPPANTITTFSASHSFPTNHTLIAPVNLQSSSSAQWIEANPGPSVGIGIGMVACTALICWIIKKCRRRILDHYRIGRRRRQVFPQTTASRTTARASVTSRSTAAHSSSSSPQSEVRTTNVRSVIIPVLDLKPVLELSRTLTAVQEETTKITTQERINSLGNSAIRSTKSPQRSPNQAKEERDILAEADIVQQRTNPTLLTTPPNTPPYAITKTQSSAAHPLTGQLISGTIKL